MTNQMVEYVTFHGDTLAVANISDMTMVAVKPIIEKIGLDRRAQQRAIQDSANCFNWGYMALVAEDGKLREMLCIAVEHVPAWLASVSLSRVKPEVRDTLIFYRNELPRYIHGREVAALKAELAAEKLLTIRLREEYLNFCSLARKVVHLAGLPFAQIKRLRKSNAVWELVEVFGDLVKFGFLKALPEGLPAEARKKSLPAPAKASQPDLFGRA